MIILLVIRIQDIRPLWKYGEELTRLLRSPMFSSLILITVTTEGDAISFLREKKIPNWNNNIKNQNDPVLDIGIGRKITLLRAKWPDAREEGYSFREGRPVLCVCNTVYVILI